MAESKGGKVTIIVALIGLVGVIATAVMQNWEKIAPAEPRPAVPTPAPYVPTPSPPRTEPLQPKEEPSVRPTDALAAMRWLESRCGSGIELVVPNPPGARIDTVARSFATALGNSGVRPIPLVVNRPGVFAVNNRFSAEKFDAWVRTSGAREGCLLAVVPEYAREQFSRPRVDAALQGSSYGIVLPRGTISEAAQNWNAVFVKANADPDFAREVGRYGLQVEVTALR